MCRLSIIVPCYNIQDRIEKLFYMLQCKGCCDYEVIFVDDCSSDNSHEDMEKIVNKFPNYKVLKTTENSGPGVARNIGLNNASGEFVMFCDSDDKTDITVLKDIILFLEKHKDADLLVFPYSIERRDKTNICDEYSQYKQGDTVRVVDVAADSGTTWSKVYRKRIIDDNEIRFPTRKSGEDKCFVVNYCKFTNKVFKIDLPYYTYVMNKMSLTHRKQNQEKITTTFEILQPIYQECFPEIVERMYAETYLLTYAKHFYSIHAKNKEIREFYEKANEKYPNWINRVDYENQSLYRKLIYKAMLKNRPQIIKFVMWLRRKIY